MKKLTFHMEHNHFTFDWFGVDSAPVLPLVLPCDITYLEVPLLDVGSYNTKTMIVYYPSVF